VGSLVRCGAWTTLKVQLHQKKPRKISPEPLPFFETQEEEFINAIRGLEEVTMVPFETGVHYMEWTEAGIRSAHTGQAIYLPL